MQRSKSKIQESSQGFIFLTLSFSFFLKAQIFHRKKKKSNCSLTVFAVQGYSFNYVFVHQFVFSYFSPHVSFGHFVYSSGSFYIYSLKLLPFLKLPAWGLWKKKEIKLSIIRITTLYSSILLYRIIISNYNWYHAFSIQIETIQGNGLSTKSIEISNFLVRKIRFNRTFAVQLHSISFICQSYVGYLPQFPNISKQLHKKLAINLMCFIRLSLCISCLFSRAAWLKPCRKNLSSKGRFSRFRNCVQACIQGSGLLQTVTAGVTTERGRIFGAAACNFICARQSRGLPSEVN